MRTEKRYLEISKKYNALSIKDLLEARDLYHVFLMQRKNVIGTAIGKYRIPEDFEITPETPRTLENTRTMDYSWPCVMVFTREWKWKGEGEDDTSLENYIPQKLYLPDGRIVPVCVINAAWQQKTPAFIPRLKFPGSVVGGGYPILNKTQGEDRWATLGCLVTDGTLVYGLTNTHVAGYPGDTIFTLTNGNEEDIGVSSKKQLQKKPFSEVYEGLPGKHSLANLDIGLIELDDVSNITSLVYGLGKVNGIFDVNHDTLSLSLVGYPVKGYGCASGVMRGEIVALFYRYKAAGGYDYVTDYLVGPRKGEEGHTLNFAPSNGDSGTLLVIDSPGKSADMKAIAVLWGGQNDVSSDNVQRYGLAANLGTVCQCLDIELVGDWNIGYDRYFGAFAHVTLPSLCVQFLKDTNLRKLMSNNTSRFSMPLGETPAAAVEGLSKAGFVPLSDVPDLVWKMRGGKYQRGKEGANHFADMDQPDPRNKNRTLLDLCRDARNVDPDRWFEFYKATGVKEKGALPFRIAQVYDAMVKSIQEGNVEKYVCAAGILTHYVFDACMPLHISYLHHGDPAGDLKKVRSKEVPLAYEVHAEFDNQLVEYYSDTISRELPGLAEKKAGENLPVAVENIDTVKDVAIAAVALMRNTMAYASPALIVNDFEELVRLGIKKKDRCQRLWETYGHGLQQAMAEAVVLTARLWEVAWMQGNGSHNNLATGAVGEDALIKLYETKEGFLDSVGLREIKSKMRWE